MAVQVAQNAIEIHLDGPISVKIAQAALEVHQVTVGFAFVSQCVLEVHTPGALFPVQITSSAMEVHTNLDIVISFGIPGETETTPPPMAMTFGINISVAGAAAGESFVGIPIITLREAIDQPPRGQYEINPYRPDTPDEFDGVDGVLAAFLREKQGTIRQQHNLIQAGDSTFPWDYMTEISPTQLYTLGSIGRFYHPLYGMIFGRYVQFKSMLELEWVNSPAGRFRSSQLVDWIVTNDLAKSNSFLAEGFVAAYETPSEGSFGWLVIAGANITGIPVADDSGFAQDEQLIWSASGELSTLGEGRVLGRVYGTPDRRILNAGQVICGLEPRNENAIRQLYYDDIQDFLTSLSLITARVTALESALALVDLDLVTGAISGLDVRISAETQNRRDADNQIRALLPEDFTGFVTTAQLTLSQNAQNSTLTGLISAAQSTAATALLRADTALFQLGAINIESLEDQINLVVSALGEVANRTENFRTDLITVPPTDEQSLVYDLATNLWIPGGPMVLRAGDIMTGSLGVVDGDAANPSLYGSGSPTTGFFFGSDAVYVTHAGVLGTTFTDTEIAQYNETDSSFFTAHGALGTGSTFTRSSNNATPPQFTSRKSRGAPSAPTVVATSDELGRFDFQGYTGATYLTSCARVAAFVTDPSPSTTAMGTEIRFSAKSNSTITTLEMVRMNPLLGLGIAGANWVINPLRHFLLRSYAVNPGTVDQAGALIYNSAMGSPGLVYSDGTNWKRLKESGLTIVSSNVNLNLNQFTSSTSPTILHTGTLTTNRTATMGAASQGARYLFAMTGSHAFNFNFNSGLFTLYTGQWVEFEYDLGTAAWHVIACGKMSIPTQVVKNDFKVVPVSDSGAFGSRGGILIPNAVCSIAALYFKFTADALVAYQADIVTLDGSNQVLAILGTATLPIGQPTTANATHKFTFAAPIALAAGTVYGILCTRNTTSGASAWTMMATGGAGLVDAAGFALVDTYIRGTFNTCTVSSTYTGGANSYWWGADFVV